MNRWLWVRGVGACPTTLFMLGAVCGLGGLGTGYAQGPVSLEAEFHYGTNGIEFPLGMCLSNQAGGLVFWSAHVGPLQLPGPGGTVFTAPGGTAWGVDDDSVVAEWRPGDDHVQWAFQMTGPGLQMSGRLARRPGGGYVATCAPRGESVVGPLAPGATVNPTFETTLEPWYSHDPGIPTSDPFVGWLDSAGRLVDYDVASGELSSYALLAAPLPDGGTIVVGTTRRGLTFRAGTPRAYELYLPAEPYDSFDLFVVHYDAAGDVVWGARHGGGDNAGVYPPPENDAAAAIVLTHDGTGFFVCGTTTGEFTANMGRHDALALPPSATQIDALVGRWETNGDLDWVLRYGGAGDDRIADIQLLPGGDPVVVGSFNGTMTLPGINGPITLVSRGGSDGFAMRLRAADGAVQWATPIGSTADSDLAWSVAIPPNGAWLAVGGQAYGPIIDNTGVRLGHTGDSDAMIVMLDPATGATTAFHSLASPGFDATYRVLALDNERLAVHGLISAGARFSFEPGVLFPNSGGWDGLVAVLRVAEETSYTETWALY